MASFQMHVRELDSSCSALGGVLDMALFQTHFSKLDSRRPSACWVLGNDITLHAYLQATCYAERSLDGQLAPDGKKHEQLYCLPFSLANISCFGHR